MDEKRGLEAMGSVGVRVWSFGVLGSGFGVMGRLRKVISRVPPCLWWCSISIPEEIRAGVRRFRRWDKALGDVQVTCAVTQISFNRSVQVPVHSPVAWARDWIAGKRGSAWAEDSLSPRRHRSGDLCHGGRSTERLSERAV